MVDKGVNSLRSDSLVGNKYMQDYLSIAIKIFAGFRYDSSDEDIRLADNAERVGSWSGLELSVFIPCFL